MSSEVSSPVAASSPATSDAASSADSNVDGTTSIDSGSCCVQRLPVDFVPRGHSASWSHPGIVVNNAHVPSTMVTAEEPAFNVSTLLIGNEVGYPYLRTQTC
ncbi:MAG: hypothetical protein HUU55_17270 [Myxococcales bacterium]|nr:hypothetical protein [Myxococcales bacterium]